MAATLSAEEEQVGPDVRFKTLYESFGSVRACTWRHFCRAHCEGTGPSVGKWSGKQSGNSVSLSGSRGCCSGCTTTSSLFGGCVLRKRPSSLPAASGDFKHPGGRCGGMETQSAGPRCGRAEGSLLTDQIRLKSNSINYLKKLTKKEQLKSH